MDYVEKLESMPVEQFVLNVQAKHDYGINSINRRVCCVLQRGYGSDATMWNVVLDGPEVWRQWAGVGPKIIEALAKAINIEMGAEVVSINMPAKANRHEGYFWTRARLQEASDMLNKGMTRSDVAKHFNKHPDGLKAALKRYGMYKPRSTSAWQSIDTAPEDGTLFLAYMGAGNMEIARYNLERNEWWVDAYAPPHIKKDWMEVWMPLPAPPSNS